MISKSQLKHGAVLSAYSSLALAPARSRPFSGAINNVTSVGHAAVRISLNFTLASAATSYSASSDSAGFPSRPHWRHSSPKFLPPQGISRTAPLMCTRAISSICSRAALNALRF